LSPVYVLEEGAYGRHTVTGVFTTIDLAKAAVPGAAADEWRESPDESGASWVGQGPDDVAVIYEHEVDRRRVPRETVPAPQSVDDYEYVCRRGDLVGWG
jgi:hypothetical protein